MNKMEKIIANTDDENIEIAPVQEGSSSSVESSSTVTETFCTNWKCINHNVKLLTLKGDEVIISDLKE
jgi:hypothetical protein